MLGVLEQSVCPALKPLRAYCKSSPYAVAKKEWEIKGVQKYHHDASTVAAVGEKAHPGTKQH